MELNLTDVTVTVLAPGHGCFAVNVQQLLAVTLHKAFKRERYRALIAGTLESLFHGNALSGLSVGALMGRAKLSIIEQQCLGIRHGNSNASVRTEM